MKILSISTATNRLSVALNEDQKILEEKSKLDPRNHNEYLDPMIAQILKQNDLRLKQIDRFAVAVGPGSYTGLRIGVTTVKMFGSILKREVVGISTLQALAEGVKAKDALIVAGLDARNNNYFAGAYERKSVQPQNVIPDGHYAITTLLEAVQRYLKTHRVQQVLFVGTGFKKQLKKIQSLDVKVKFGTDEQNEVHAGLIGRLATHAQTIAPDRLLPHYLRRTQAELDWHRRTGKPYGPDSQYVEEV